jgi:hypothetical protein
MRPVFHFNLLQFALIFIWSIFAFSIGWERLAVAHSDPMGWFLVSSIIVGGLSFALVLISWYMKQQVKPHDFQWDQKQQEIVLSEYEILYKEYLSNYSHLIARFDARDFILFVVMLLSTLLIPFFMSLGISTILMSPFIFGFLTILYGIALSRFSFRVLPSSSNIDTTLVPVSRMRKVIHASGDVDGVAFSGVSLDIGEAGGYYQISNVQPVFRLEGIESASRIQFILDESKIVAETTFLDQPIEVQYENESTSILHQSIQHIMKLVYRAYIANKGTEPLLDDLMSELDIDISDI